MGPRVPVAEMSRPNTNVRPELPFWVHSAMESPAKSLATTGSGTCCPRWTCCACRPGGEPSCRACRCGSTAAPRPVRTRRAYADPPQEADHRVAVFVDADRGPAEPSIRGRRDRPKRRHATRRDPPCVHSAVTRAPGHHRGTQPVDGDSSPAPKTGPAPAAARATRLCGSAGQPGTHHRQSRTATTPPARHPTECSLLGGYALAPAGDRIRSGPGEPAAEMRRPATWLFRLTQTTAESPASSVAASTPNACDDGYSVITGPIGPPQPHAHRTRRGHSRPYQLRLPDPAGGLASQPPSRPFPRRQMRRLRQ